MQFAPIPAYASVHAMKIWELFRPEFPKIQEKPIIDPQFETFGGTSVQTGAQFIVGAPPVGSRIWFISEDENHLLQFQSDRFISNWRRQPNTRPYPHFEGLAQAFSENLGKLDEHLYSSFSYHIYINQAEISYINIIPVDEFSQVGEWFEICNGGALDIESLSVNFSEVIRDRNEKPFARLNHQLQSVFTADGKSKAFRLSLSFRGKPHGDDLEAAMNFLAAGREAIVSRFSQITTAQAQASWGKIK